MLKSLTQHLHAQRYRIEPGSISTQVDNLGKSCATLEFTADYSLDRGCSGVGDDPADPAMLEDVEFTVEVLTVGDYSVTRSERPGWFALLDQIAAGRINRQWLLEMVLDRDS